MGGAPRICMVGEGIKIYLLHVTRHNFPLQTGISAHGDRSGGA